MYAYQFRLIVVGDSTVGKSSLLRYFCDGKFADDSDPTVGVDFYARIVEIKPSVRVKLQIWDTAGQERFRSITRSYYRNSVGALLLYDTTNYDSFEHVNDWLQEAKKQIEPHQSVFILVGTKQDKEHLREVPVEQAQQFADYHNLLFLETSSKTGFNVEKTFIQLATKIYELLEEGKFRIQEGWDGIKSGYMQSNPALMSSSAPNSVANPRPPISLANNDHDNSGSSDDSRTKKSCC